MKLYKQLQVLSYDAKIYIHLWDDYDMNASVHFGTVEEARQDDNVWEYMGYKVFGVSTYRDVLVICLSSKKRIKDLYVDYEGFTGPNCIEKKIDEFIEKQSRKQAVREEV